MKKQRRDRKKPHQRQEAAWRWPRWLGRRGLALLAVAMSIALAISLGLGGLQRRNAETERILFEAQDAFAKGDPAKALELAQILLMRQPESGPALILAAQAAAGLGRVDEAVELFDRIAAAGGRDGTDSLVAAAELLLQNGRASGAEDYFRRALGRDPEHDQANFRLGYLLSIEGRAWEARPFVLHALKRDECPVEHLVWIGRPDAMVNKNTAAVLRACLDAVPGDPVPKTGLAKAAMREKDDHLAGELLRQVVASRPDQGEAQSLLGSLLLDAGDDEAIQAWRRDLPETALKHPSTWAVLGRLADQHEQPRGALRCYLEAIRRDPNHRQATYQSSLLFKKFGDGELAEHFGRRADWLAEVDAVVELVNSNKQDLELVRKAAFLCEQLGRHWEALGWYRHALTLQPQNAALQLAIARLQTALSPATPSSETFGNLPRRINVGDYPLPDWGVESTADAGKHAAVKRRIAFQFVNVAEATGLRFQYYNDHDPKLTVMRMIEATGGGAGILDYDQDGWPDIYLTQACDWPPGPDRDLRHVDRLYRNQGDGSFLDVTNLAGLAETGYSQGVAIGDYNSDGFPDVYVANFGPNCFYENNGDGTFRDATQQTGTAGADWTASCALADLNGDALPDLYAVNYLAGSDVDSRICKDNEGVLRSCMPNLFPGAQDRVYLNLGDGRFEDQTSTSGIVTGSGRGLGIIVADFENCGKLHIFVGNDAEANFYFVNETGPASGKLAFAEQALVCGLAFNDAGKAQACMGIAAGDFLNDGLLDLLVTNYYADTNTFYRQSEKGLFRDATREVGLSEPSYHVLGYGSQFLDAELDGSLDLVVANGHEGNYKDLGIPYEMEPQFFYHDGSGRFADVSSRVAGGYFQKKYVARGLARLDWNRDGREDFVVSHLDQPVALVTNESSPAGSYLAVRLHGVDSCRDAIGARVTVSTPGSKLTKQLIAGDGYMASNERVLIFGLGKLEHIDELTVQWPSGKNERFGGLPANREVVLVEGNAAPIIRKR